MDVLLDANLSYRLVKKTAGLFGSCLHVTRTGLPIPDDDIAIWQWAKVNNKLIVTNDDDYYNLASVFGFPPKVVLLRMGNQSSANVVTTLQKHFNAIKDLADSEVQGLLELF